jgi:hypothetical protein
MPGAFLYANLVDAAAALTCAQAIVPTMPLENIRDPQPRMRARLVGSSAAIIVDLGASRALDCAALVGTTLTASATIRVRLATADATGAAGDAWDTGILTASPGATSGQVVVIRGAGTASGRYLRIDLADGALAVIDVGRIAAGALWRLTRGHSYGITEGQLMLDRRDRNPLTGAEFPVPAVANPRVARFQLAALTQTEALGQHRAMLATLGAAGDGLWVPELALSQAEINARSIWGALAEPGAAIGLSRAALALFGRGFTLTERV